MYPDDLKYSETHQWVRVQGDIATIGMTDYAQEQMGDLVYAEVPEAGRRLIAGEPFASIESVKAVQDLTAPVGGVVVESNSTLSDTPETVNRDPYGEGWLAKVEMEDAGELKNLWTAQRYQEFLKTL